MKKRTGTLLIIILIGIIGLCLAGCAGAPTATAPAKTRAQMLQEAGFKMYKAQTPQELAHLKVCPPETLMIHERQGATCYAFSDPATNTMYIGDEAAYWRFNDMLEKQAEKIQEQKIQSDPEFWPMWGPRWGGG